MKFLIPRSAVTLAIALVFALSAPFAKAALTVVAEETGGNVVFTFSGSLNLPSSTAKFPNSPETYLNPSQGGLVAWQTAASADNYPFQEMVPFGTGESTYNVGVGAGDNIGIYSTALSLNESYVSGAPLNATLTFANTTLAALGVDSSGSPYVWTLTGTNDTITLTVSSGEAAKAVARKIKKLQKKAKKLAKKGQKAKAKKLKRKIKKLKRLLKAL